MASSLNTAFPYAIIDKWIADAEFGWLDVDTDLDSNGRFEGAIRRWGVGIRWQAFKNLGLSAGYESFDVNAEAFDADFNGTIDYSYHGPCVGISLMF